MQPEFLAVVLGGEGEITEGIGYPCALGCGEHPLEDERLSLDLDGVDLPELLQ